jgi:hypothetical protein
MSNEIQINPETFNNIRNGYLLLKHKKNELLNTVKKEHKIIIQMMIDLGICKDKINIIKKDHAKILRYINNLNMPSVEKIFVNHDFLP